MNNSVANRLQYSLPIVNWPISSIFKDLVFPMHGIWLKSVRDTQPLERSSKWSELGSIVDDTLSLISKLLC